MDDQKIAFKGLHVIPGFATFGSNDLVAHNSFETIGVTFKVYNSSEGNTRFVVCANAHAGVQPPSRFFQREVEIFGGIAAALFRLFWHRDVLVQVLMD